MDQDQDLPSQINTVRSPLANTRVLDNHYDPKIHEKPWIAIGCLRDYKYDYGDSGLGFMMSKTQKLKNFKERHEQIKEVEELNRKSKGFRHFREYENVRNNEIVITIEYCTNCKEHQGSTRHDEEKYLFFANSLKREIILQYPIVKVVLKPLIFDPKDESTESFYLRSRLGAFEVQFYSKTSKGELIKKYIFSKLRTRNWPLVSRVVDDISMFLPSSDFVVRLIDYNFNPEEIKEENESSMHSSPPKAQTNKLKGLHVIMRPVRSLTKNSPRQSEYSTSRGLGGESSRLNSSRPISGLRPQSAYSSVSSKNSLSATKKPSTKKEGSTTSISAPPKEFVEQSDAFGVAIFKNIPHSIYEIEVIETQNYLAEKRVVNIFDLIENGAPLREEIALKEHTMGFCRVSLVSNHTAFTDASIIVAKKHPEPNSKTAVLREKDPRSGIFEFMIDPGEYVLCINKVGYGEKKVDIIANRGANEYNIEMEGPSSNYVQKEELRSHASPQKPVSRQTEEKPVQRQRPPSSKGRENPHTITAKGVQPKENVNQGKVETGSPQKNNSHQEAGHNEETKQKERVKSALVKKADFYVLDIDTGKPISGASIMLSEIGFQGNTNDQGKCSVPVSRLNRGKMILDHENYFGMVEEYGDDDEDDIKHASEKKFNLIPRPNDMNEVQLRFIPGKGAKCCQFHVLFSPEDEAAKKDIIVQHEDRGKVKIILKNLLKKQGVFRVIAELTNIPDFLHPDSMFILSHVGDCDQLYILPPNEKLLTSQKLIWDVGFFADPVVNPQFFEINAYSNKDIGLYTSLKEYQMLLNYLHNSKSDMKTLLGFKEKNKIERDGDILIPKETIYSSLDKYGLEIKNVDHLLSSACTPDGLYSFKECERRFGSLKPPFNFVKEAKKGVAGNAAISGEDSNEEEEYLFEDEQ